MTLWKHIASSMPADATTVWIALHAWFDAPRQATLNEGAESFDWTDSNGFTHAIPIWAVLKWRPL